MKPCLAPTMYQYSLFPFLYFTYNYTTVLYKLGHTLCLKGDVELNHLMGFLHTVMWYVRAWVVTDCKLQSGLAVCSWQNHNNIAHPDSNKLFCQVTGSNCWCSAIPHPKLENSFIVIQCAPHEIHKTIIQFTKHHTHTHQTHELYETAG